MLWFESSLPSFRVCFKNRAIEKNLISGSHCQPSDASEPCLGAAEGTNVSPRSLFLSCLCGHRAEPGTKYACDICLTPDNVREAEQSFSNTESASSCPAPHDIPRSDDLRRDNCSVLPSAEVPPSEERSLRGAFLIMRQTNSHEAVGFKQFVHKSA